MAYLKVQESIAPKGLWHWVVICDNGHIWDCSKESVTSLEEAISMAQTKGIESLYSAIKAEIVVDKK